MIASRGRIAVAAVFAASPAAVAFEGRYARGDSGYSQSLAITKRGDGRYGVQADVATRGCVGSFEGVGQVKGAILTARTGERDDRCVLTVTKSGRGVTVKEDSCLLWRGAACEFSGSYRRSAR